MLLNRFLPQPDAALCVSAAVRPTAVHSYGIDTTRLHVLPNAVDAAALRPSATDIRSRLRAEWRVADGAPVILSTSRFSCEKRLDALIGMIPEVLKAVPDSVFVLAGAGPDLESCRELAARLGVTHATRLLGHRDDVADLLAAADAAVMLCQYEAFGNSAAEALAVGVPVVGYAAGGLAEVVKHEATGLLAPKGDDRAFIDSLVRLLLDSDLRQRLGAHARKDAERFAVDRHAVVLLRTYSTLLVARSNVVHTQRMQN
jgi:glycosyltransferase involved in cell wall biosynthesis